MSTLPYDKALLRFDSLASDGPQSRARVWPQIYFGVASASLGSLLLELALTRLFSVIYFYHFAFLAISIALFGLGAGGLFSYAIANWRTPFFSKLGVLAAINSVVVVACLWFLLARTGQMAPGALIAAYFVAALPFFISGAIISGAISETVERVRCVYFFDLSGAACACVALVPLLNWIGGPNTILVSGVLFAVSSAIWFHVAHVPRGRILAVMIGLSLVLLITYNSKYLFLDVKFAKGKQITGEEFVKWNSFSRIALKPEQPGSAKQSIVIDADAATSIANFDFAHLSPRDHFDLTHEGPGLPYLLRPAAKTLVIGSGGGWDVARALASGSEDVTAVEINPIIATVIMRKQFPQDSRGLYLRNDVRVFVEDGRSFIRRSRDKYDVLQATLVDTWASTAAGALALSENNLYTTDAFADYLAHLTPNGVLAFTRWGFSPPRESLRIVSLAMAALKRFGTGSAERNVIVMREDSQKLKVWGAQDTILISRSPFTSAEIAAMETAAQTGPAQIVYAPGTDRASAFRDLLLSRDAQAFYGAYPFDVRPVTDDRPFFFYTVQPRDVWDFLLHGSRVTADYKVNSALPPLLGLVLASIIAVLVIVSLPPIVLGNRFPALKETGGALLFFVWIGAGYVLIQVALIQKFILFLGHPTYALTVVVFSMLLASGAGSFWSERIIQQNFARLRRVAFFIAGAIAILVWLVPRVTEAGVAIGLGWKILISIALISPAAFAMGMPFPTGLTLVNKAIPDALRWAWAVNAAASVMGSAAAMLIAIYLGLKITLAAGAVLYLLAAIATPRISEFRKSVRACEASARLRRL